MIVTRSPLRITLGGGGTDLASYYRDHEGFVISAAINKYVYITLHETFEQELIVKYSKFERVRSAGELQHPIVREALALVGITKPNLEIASMADIPAGTGLGSSGSFTTALLKALHIHSKNFLTAEQLAQEACHIEIERLKEPIGKQDQYIAAYGGLTCFRYLRDDRVECTPLRLQPSTLYDLEDNLMLFFTGHSRSASAILKDQDSKSRQQDQKMIDNLHFIKDLGFKSLKALEGGDLEEFARLMNVHWEHKRARSQSITSGQIDQWYDLAMSHGALGGKLIGAGGGGFLMFYAADRNRLRTAMADAGLREVRFHFDFEGSKVVVL